MHTHTADLSKRSTNERAVFTNSELSLKYVDVYGFDFDYTLVHYTREVHRRIYEMARDRLVAKLKVCAVRLCPQLRSTFWRHVQGGFVYWIILCYHPYLVSLLFADLLSLHLLMFSELVRSWNWCPKLSHSSWVGGYKSLVKLWSCEQAVRSCTALCKMLLFIYAKTVVIDLHNFELACLKKEEEEEENWFLVFGNFLAHIALLCY